MRPAAKATSGRRSDDDRSFELTVEHVVHLRRVVHDLIEASGEEIGEHDLGHGPHAHHSGSYGRADDGRLGQRCVPHSVLAVFLEETAGDTEIAPHLTDVLAEQVHSVILIHHHVQRAVKRLHHVHLCHRASTSQPT